ncbi:hypothetical protein pb186bvf_016205 [Paramecium bursaria]
MIQICFFWINPHSEIIKLKFQLQIIFKNINLLIIQNQNIFLYHLLFITTQTRPVREYKYYPNYLKFSFKHMIILYNIGYLKEAIQMYDLAIKIDPNVASLMKLGIAYQNLGQLRDAIQMYNFTIKIYPNYESIEIYNMAIKINPNDQRLYYNKALEDLGLNNEAQNMLQICAAINPNYLEQFAKQRSNKFKKYTIELKNIIKQYIFNWQFYIKFHLIDIFDSAFIIMNQFQKQYQIFFIFSFPDFPLKNLFVLIYMQVNSKAQLHSNRIMEKCAFIKLNQYKALLEQYQFQYNYQLILLIEENNIFFQHQCYEELEQLKDKILSFQKEKITQIEQLINYQQSVNNSRISRNSKQAQSNLYLQQIWYIRNKFHLITQKSGIQLNSINQNNFKIKYFKKPYYIKQQMRLPIQNNVNSNREGKQTQIASVIKQIELITKIITDYQLKNYKHSLEKCQDFLQNYDQNQVVLFWQGKIFIFQKQNANLNYNYSIDHQKLIVIYQISLNLIHFYIINKEKSFYDIAIQCNPNHARYYFNKGNLKKFIKGIALKDIGQLREANEMLDLAIRIDPNDVRIYINKGYQLICLLGNILFNMGQPNEAIETYEKALRLNPNISLLYLNKGYLQLQFQGIALYSIGQKQKAILMYDQAQKIEPNDVINTFIVFRISSNKSKLIKIGDLDVRYSYSTQSKRRNTLFQQRLYNKIYYQGTAHQEIGQFKEAILAYNKAIQYNPTDERIYINKAMACENLGQFKEAIKMYDMAIKYNPNDARIYIKKGISLYGLGMFTEAIEQYDIAIKIDPYNATAYINKGNSYQGLGKKIEALEMYDIYIRYNPADSNSYYNNGNCLTGLGRLNEAIEMYDIALKMNPNDIRFYMNKGRFIIQNLSKLSQRSRKIR